jgi:hypothetical protein
MESLERLRFRFEQFGPSAIALPASLGSRVLARLWAFTIPVVAFFGVWQ